MYEPLISKMSRAGFTALLLDVDVLNDTNHSSQIDVLAAEMTRCLRSPPPSVGVPPFPPVLVARHASCILAEVYASSNPITALQLIDPPVSLSQAAHRFPELPHNVSEVELNFEALFPLRVSWTKEELPQHEMHRIEEAQESEIGEGFERSVWPSLEAGAQDMLDWMENEIGL